MADVCMSVGLRSVGSFTTSFTRTYGISPQAYRVQLPRPADLALIPGCVVRADSRPQRRTFAEDSGAARTYKELRDRGVEFTEEPDEPPYGIDSAFRDPSGNPIRLTQVREMAAL